MELPVKKGLFPGPNSGQFVLTNQTDSKRDFHLARASRAQQLKNDAGVCSMQKMKEPLKTETQSIIQWDKSRKGFRKGTAFVLEDRGTLDKHAI